MSFIDTIKARAKGQRKTIVLPESLDRRTVEATATIIEEDFCDIVLIGNPDKITEIANGLDITSAKIINPDNFESMEAYVDKLVALRGHKGMTREEARAKLRENPLYFGVMMVKMNDVDGMVAGACHSTADVLRPSLQILKTAPNTKIVSSFFVMVVPDCDLGSNGTFIFSDCGLVQNPNAEELAAIAGSSATSFRRLLGLEPIVAMLSHSTMGSASHPDVDKVKQATAIAKKLYVDIKIDGEFQLDAAIVPSIGLKKAPNSCIAGSANVLIFPDLDAANIGYKLTQRLAKAEAYGPITQGIAKPVNDLSRGCSASDIVGVTAITAVQAQ